MQSRQSFFLVLFGFIKYCNENSILDVLDIVYIL